MKLRNKLLLGTMAFLLTIFNLSEIRVFAAEESSEFSINDLSGYEMLNDNAKLIVTELCEGADNISSHIPNATVVTQDSMALALPDTKVNQNVAPIIISYINVSKRILFIISDNT